MNQEKKQLLVFGYGLAVILAFFSWRIGEKHGYPLISFVLLALSVTFLFVTAIEYTWLKPVYVRWMMVAGMIGKVVSTLILSVIFYFIFGIVGIILRLMRKDLLDRSWEPEKKSYWIARPEVPYTPEHSTRQF